MTLVRRLAIHGAWLAAVTAFAVAVAFLAAAGLTAIARVIQGSSADLWSEVRGYVAFAVGTGLVAVPAWLVVRRILRRLLAEPGELASATHALASLAASGLAIIVAVQLVGMGASLLAMEASFSDGSEASLTGIVPIAAGLVGGLVWLLVAAARVREVAVARPVGIAAGITRVALYGPLVYFVGLTVSSVAQTLTLAVGLLDPGGAGGVISYEPDPYEANYVLLGGLVPALAAAIALIPHAWYARRLVGKSRPFAPEEVAALTRRAAWALVAISSLGWLLAGLTGVLTAALRAVLDVPGLSALGAGPAAEAAAAALGLLPALVVAAIGWAWHRGRGPSLGPRRPASSRADVGLCPRLGRDRIRRCGRGAAAGVPPHLGLRAGTGGARRPRAGRGRRALSRRGNRSLGDRLVARRPTPRGRSPGGAVHRAAGVPRRNDPVRVRGAAHRASVGPGPGP